MAFAVIHTTTPTVSEEEHKGIIGAKQERSLFLTESYNVGTNHPEIMTLDYNHAHHATSNKLVVDYNTMIDYVNQKLLADLHITRLVVGDQAVREGKKVMNAAQVIGKTNSGIKTIWETLRRLYQKKAVPSGTPPTT